MLEGFVVLLSSLIAEDDPIGLEDSRKGVTGYPKTRRLARGTDRMGRCRTRPVTASPYPPTRALLPGVLP